MLSSAIKRARSRRPRLVYRMGQLLRASCIEWVNRNGRVLSDALLSCSGAAKFGTIVRARRDPSGRVPWRSLSHDCWLPRWPSAM
jgi:hypothetical protein